MNPLDGQSVKSIQTDSEVESFIMVQATTITLPVVDLGPFLADPMSEASQAECKKVFHPNFRLPIH
jgi:hypothetical protein